MKKILLPLFALLMLVSASQAQNTTFTQDLDQVISLAQNCRTYARNTRDALRTLAVQYFQLGNTNPNVAAYLAVMDVNMAALESAQDDIAYYARQAKLKNAAIDVDNILAWASDLEAREDYVRIESANLAAAIASNNVQAARVANNLIRGYLGEQIQLSNDIIADAQAQKLVAQVYNVRIALVDPYNNPVTGSTGLQGYYAESTPGTYFYPSYLDADLFEGLAGGTYTFGGFNGYFDGVSSTTVTLTPALINGDGEVIVTLSYWSE